jgi:hypothetical protein
MTPSQASILLQVLKDLSIPEALQPFVDEACSSEEAEREARIQMRLQGKDAPGNVQGTKYEFAHLRQLLPKVVAQQFADAASGKSDWIDLEYIGQIAFVEHCRRKGITIYSDAFRDVAVTRDDGTMYLHADKIREMAAQYRQGPREIQ